MTLDNQYILTAAYYGVGLAIIIIGLLIFEIITKYKDWTEIKNGNLSAALVTGGKILGIGIILSYAITSNDSLWQTFIWGAYGVILQIVTYYLFEFFTPWFKVDEEIAKDNRAVGAISFLVSITIAFVVGASIT